MPYPAQIVDTKWLPKETGASRYLEAVSPARRADGSETVDDEADSDQPRYSRDSILNALAQLGASRLGVKRAMISIVTRSVQHVIAEATRTVSLTSKNVHDPDDGIWMGCCSLPTSAGLCQWTVSQADRYRETTGSNEPGDVQRCFVVNNLAEDDRFKDAPFVTGAPFARFYAGAPIISKSTGKTFGSYCVFDNTPIYDFGSDSIQLMVDMADAVADHLELVRIRLDRSRSEKMVRGIGSFIEGKASIREWWSSSRTELAPSKFDDSPKAENATSPGAEEEGSRVSRSVLEVTSMTSEPKAQNLDKKVDSKTWLHKLSSYSSASKETGPGISPTLAKNSTSTDVKELFARASTIIREAAELQGVFFLDASSASRPSNSQRGRKSEYSSSATTSGEELPPSQSDEALEFCSVLGYSTVDASSINPADAALDAHSVDEALLRSLLRRYPTGKIFNLDEFSSSDSETASLISDEPEDITKPSAQIEQTESGTEHRLRSRRSKVPRRSDIANLARVFPGARSVAFCPLWDAQKGRWYAGAIAYTNQVLRTLSSDGELSYLAAFGNSIMAEVSRMVAVRDDRAKADFISSISHELRSPLHGILGNAEFLKGTPLEALQADMVHSIETCGRTLLDTINHLLDFAKINNFLRSGGKGDLARRGSGFTKAEAKANPRVWMISLESDLDLAVLTEEVTQTAFAGYDFYMQSTSIDSDLIASPRYNQTTFMSKPLAGKKRLSVILDIRPANSYVFRAQAGALRRVLMNACGNALKYTNSGFVRVELQRKTTPQSHGSDISEVTLTISDSGKGISKAYLRDKLFTPFAQEDPYSPGTGLGLSIVKQITKSLHGSIDVQSEVNVGTSVKITLKLKHSEINPEPAQQHETKPIQDRDGVSKVASELKDWKVAMYGFATIDDPSTTLPASETARKESKAYALLQKSLERMCTSWFGMQVYDPGKSHGITPDIYITDLAAADELRLQSETLNNDAPVVVVCPNSDIAAHATNAAELSGGARIFVFVAQPLGPVKFARVMSTLLQRGADKQNHEHFSNVSAKYKVSDPAPPSATDKKLAARPPITRADSILLETPVAGIERPVIQDTTSKPAASGFRLLLVEDNNINLQLLVAFCKKQKAAYTTATNGLEALEAYRAAGGAFDCILMDISMPVMDGMESTREIRQYEREMGLKPASIVALTGLASEAAQNEAFGSGIDLFLTKPVKLLELKDLLQEALDGQGEVRVKVK